MKEKLMRKTALFMACLTATLSIMLSVPMNARADSQIRAGAKTKFENMTAEEKEAFKEWVLNYEDVELTYSAWDSLVDDLKTLSDDHAEWTAEQIEAFADGMAGLAEYANATLGNNGDVISVLLEKLGVYVNGVQFFTQLSTPQNLIKMVLNMAKDGLIGVRNGTNYTISDKFADDLYGIVGETLGDATLAFIANCIDASFTQYLGYGMQRETATKLAQSLVSHGGTYFAFARGYEYRYNENPARQVFEYAVSDGDVTFSHDTYRGGVTFYGTNMNFARGYYADNSNIAFSNEKYYVSNYNEDGSIKFNATGVNEAKGTIGADSSVTTWVLHFSSDYNTLVSPTLEFDGNPYQVYYGQSYANYSTSNDNSFTVSGDYIRTANIANDYGTITNSINNDYSSENVTYIVNNYYDTNPVPTSQGGDGEGGDGGDGKNSILAFLDGLRSFLDSIIELIGGILDIVGDLLRGLLGALSSFTDFKDDFGDFLTENMTFIPAEGVAVIVAGISAMVVIGVIKLIKR